ncbi:unnamed protein product [Allacma fusca]|uniref:DDE Tnp4 domain-containing protein n=1 Tax=Allacma fusca TaxID=39272 RepID=A0A8J2LD64_9HEXA|nr:unnamed protein product [Allacma fusca]
MTKISGIRFRVFGPLLCIWIGIGKCSIILQPEFRNYRLNSSVLEPRAGKSYSSKINGHENGEHNWSSESADNHISSSDLTSVSNDQYSADTVSHHHGWESEPSHTKTSYSHGKGSPPHHGWTSHSVHQNGWDGWKHEHGWGNHGVSYGHESWYDSWAKIKSWFGPKALWGSAYLLSFVQGLLVLLPIAILIGLLIHYREDITTKLQTHLPIGCVRSSNNELWKTTSELTQKILSSEDCVQRIACEIGHTSFVDSLSSYLSSGYSKLIVSNQVQPLTDRKNNGTNEDPCGKFSCEPIEFFVGIPDMINDDPEYYFEHFRTTPETFHELLMCDANYKFILTNCGASGSGSDGGIFRRSEIGKRVLNHTLDLPAPGRIDGINTLMPYCFVGDEAFPLLKNLMRPYPGDKLDISKRVFNYRLSRARRIIENTFGILVARWQLLKDNFIKSQQKLKRLYMPAGFVDTEDHFTGEIVPGIWRSMVNCTQELSRQGSNNYQKEASGVREEFKDFFNGQGSVPWQMGNIIDY